MDTKNLDSMMARMQAMQAAMNGLPGAPASNPVNSANGVDFQNILKNAIENVNNAQNAAQAKAQAFSAGNSDTSLEEVIVSLQKANLSLQGMIAVRNRLVDAYKEVTSLQV
ncbi:MAG: flagellar hook-basal body complex protein FliE [Burkholderiaceae bacterium]|nr:flagellar hook-basal body complex protein FliE [Burkholderiaceae bacterium]